MVEFDTAEVPWGVVTWDRVLEVGGQSFSLLQGLKGKTRQSLYKRI